MCGGAGNPTRVESSGLTPQLESPMSCPSGAVEDGDREVKRERISMAMTSEQQKNSARDIQLEMVRQAEFQRLIEIHFTFDYGSSKLTLTVSQLQARIAEVQRLLSRTTENDASVVRALMRELRHLHESVEILNFGDLACGRDAVGGLVEKEKELTILEKQLAREKKEIEEIVNRHRNTETQCRQMTWDISEARRRLVRDMQETGRI